MSSLIVLTLISSGTLMASVSISLPSTVVLMKLRPFPMSLSIVRSSSSPALVRMLTVRLRRANCLKSGEVLMLARWALEGKLVLHSPM